MTCSSCRYRVAANSGETLCRLPAHVRACYPVETKHTLADKNCHISQLATNVFDLLMPMYGNGDLCSKLLCNTINRSYMERVQSYYSFYKSTGRKEPPEPYVEKDGTYITAYPPLSDGIRDTYDVASSNTNAHWMISDHNRHAQVSQEIQRVGCGLIFAQDHTFDLRSTKYFWQRYDKYLRKEIRPPHVLCSKLDAWFDRYKCSSSANSRPTRGRKDSNTGETLFTPETKEAIKNCKEKAKHIQDALQYHSTKCTTSSNPVQVLPIN